jgi:hypothetical protein
MDQAGIRLPALEWVQIDLGEDDHDHLITSEQRFKITMARQ